MSDSHDAASVWADRGAPPEREPKRRRRRWPVIAALVAAGAIGAVVAVLAADGSRDRRDAVAAQERLEAEERERLIREGRPVRTTGPAGSRARLVEAGEAAITADARARLETGELDQPILGTRCRPFPFTDTRAAQESDPAIERNRYQCTAFNRRFDLPELEGRERTGYIGQPYWLIAEYETGALTFCKITPRPGEGGRALATALVDPACRDPLS